jgi:hypothetical protein
VPISHHYHEQHKPPSSIERHTRKLKKKKGRDREEKKEIFLFLFHHQMKLSNCNQSLNTIAAVFSSYKDTNENKKRTNERPGRKCMGCTSTISCVKREYRRRKKRNQYNHTRERENKRMRE